MNDYNRVAFTGRFTADPEGRFTGSGTAHCSVGVAINGTRGTGDAKRENVDCIEVAHYGKLAELVGKDLSKGSFVLVEGRLAQQRWDDRTTGQKRSRGGVIADSVQFLDRKKEKAPEQVADVFSGAELVGEEEIPF